MEKLILQCENLSKTYGNSKLALSNVNLRLYSGKIIGLLGPNGSGKTTLIKIINGLLTPSFGGVLIDGQHPGVHTKSIVSYLPEMTYLDNNMRVSEALIFFQDFYSDFRIERANEMLSKLAIDPNQKFKTLSKGTKEKVQLILVMSRDAQLYVLDEPIAGVDPAAREYILNTILKNYNRTATMIISTHLITDIEQVLDEAIFINNGNIVLHESVENIKKEKGCSLDELFREVFRCLV